MFSFFSRVLRPKARGRAPSARGEEAVNAFLRDGFGSDDLRVFLQEIHAADPQRGRRAGVTGRGSTSASVLPSRDTTATYHVTSETVSLDDDNNNNNNTDTIHSIGHASGTESAWVLTPPTSLLIEVAGGLSSVDESFIFSEGGGTRPSHASSYYDDNNSPGSHASSRTRQWIFSQDVAAALMMRAALYDSDALTLVGTGSMSADSLRASSEYDGEAYGIDSGGLAASQSSSSANSVQGGGPGPASSGEKSSGSLALDNGAGESLPVISTSELNFSSSLSFDIHH